MQGIIITAYKDPQMLYRLVEKFDAGHYRVFVHIDKRYFGEFDIKRLKRNGNVEVYSKYAVTWGSIKHLYAILGLIKRALRHDDIRYIHIISGQDYPVGELLIAENDDHIYLDFAPVLEERYRQYNPCQKMDQKNRIAEKIYRGSVKLQKLAGITRETIGSYNKIYKGTIWSSMPAQAARYACNIAENDSKFIRDLYYPYLPEEIFFQTIFMNSSEWKDKIIRDNKRYDDWTPRNGSDRVPLILDERDHERIRKSGKWFARKLDSEKSGRLPDLIDGKKKIEENGLISIVITTCNRSADILRRAVKSAYEQTWQNKEIVVINDAPENAPEVEEALKGFDDVRLVNNEKQHGVSHVRNLGVKEAKGKYIAFLDDDDEWLPDKLKLQAEQFDDQTGLVYCDYFAIKDGKTLKYDENKAFPQGWALKELLGDNFVGGCSIPLIKKEALSDAGEFDTNISYGEDYDMWLRIAKKYKIGCVRKRLVKYYIGAPSLTGSFERRMEGWEYLLEKHKADYEKYPSEYDRYTGTNVREAAKRTSIGYSFGVWKKYGQTKEYLKGIIMRILGIF